MNKIPLYLKTDDDMSRPAEPAYYLLGRNGMFLCRNHPFFQSDVPVQHTPAWLAGHAAGCRLNYPKLPVSTLEYIVGFFRQIYQLHGSEAIVLLYWDVARRRYRLRVPAQTATVWESSWGTRSAMDVSYRVPVPPPGGCLLVASIHSHADGEAYSSWTDQHDEVHRDGIHIVCGRVHRDPPEFHLEFAVDRQRFKLEFGHFFRGYQQPRRAIPQVWTEQVQCRVLRPKWAAPPARPRSDGSRGYHGQA